MDKESVNQQVNDEEVNLGEPSAATDEAADEVPVKHDGAEPAEATEDDELTKLAEKNAELVSQITMLKDDRLRLMAEFDNFRKNKAKEIAGLKNVLADGIFRDMLPVVDDLERAMQNVENAPDIDALKEGMALIYKKFMDYLAKNGVEPIDTDGAEFDTNLHEAIATLPAQTEEQKNKIIDCTTRGYKHGDTVIRHAKVVVNI